VTTPPLVSVICLSYNHDRFVEEAIGSVLKQTYPNIQVIAVDDGSTDNTAEAVRKLVATNPSIEFLPLAENVGNCRAFNQGLALAKGKYIIDFATDDVMLEDRVRQQVEFFESLDKSYGVVFTDSVYITSTGTIVRKHYEHLFAKKLIPAIPQGDVYREVLSEFFISSPTMMARSEVFDYLHGYDEQLAYEDFDFWVRSARVFKYAFLDRITTKVRLTDTSLSKGLYRKGDRQVHSTYLVCRKAVELNESPEDDKALAKRLRYEIRHCVFTQNNDEAKLFYNLLTEIGYKDPISDALIFLNMFRLPWGGIRRLYHRLRFGKDR
jgi:glycosyltransferase involved in cell wall biosynthesis